MTEEPKQSHYYRATVTQTVVVLAPNPGQAQDLIRRHFPGRCVYGISAEYGRFEVNGTAIDLEVGDVHELSPTDAGRYLTRSQEVERQLRELKKGQDHPWR